MKENRIKQIKQVKCKIFKLLMCEAAQFYLGIIIKKMIHNSSLLIARKEQSANCFQVVNFKPSISMFYIFYLSLVCV